jgi:molecular chaperone GrpE
VQQELVKALRTTGLQTINPARGAEFDPQQHSAVMHQPSDDVPPGSVMQVLQTGYMLGDFVLRPAKVVISSTEEHETTGDEA